jgi:hypothetical protein
LIVVLFITGFKIEIAGGVQFTKLIAVVLVSVPQAFVTVIWKLFTPVESVAFASIKPLL